MNVYVALDLFNGKLLERFESEEEWEKAKRAIKSSKIIHVALEAGDPELKEFKEICWTRYEPGYRDYKLKVVIPFLPNDVEKMEKLAQEQIDLYEEEYQKIKAKLKSDHEEKKRRRKEKIKEEAKAFYYSISPETANLTVDEVSWFHTKAIKEMEGLEGCDALILWRELGFPMPAPIQVVKEKDGFEGTWKDFMVFCLFLDLTLPADIYDPNKVFSDSKEEELNEICINLDRNFQALGTLHFGERNIIDRNQEGYNEIVNDGIHLWKQYAKLCKEMRK